MKIKSPKDVGVGGVPPGAGRAGKDKGIVVPKEHGMGGQVPGLPGRAKGPSGLRSPFYDNPTKQISASREAGNSDRPAPRD